MYFEWKSWNIERGEIARRRVHVVSGLRGELTKKECRYVVDESDNIDGLFKRDNDRGIILALVLYASESLSVESK